MTQEHALTEACRRLDMAQALFTTVLRIEADRRTAHNGKKSYQSLLELVGTSIDEIEDMSAVVDTEDLRAALNAT